MAQYQPTAMEQITPKKGPLLLCMWQLHLEASQEELGAKANAEVVRTAAHFSRQDYRNVLLPDKWIITIFLHFTMWG